MFDSPNGPVTPIEDIDTAVVPGLVTVTDWAELVEPTFSLPNDSLDGEAVSALGPPLLPPPGKTSNSESCAADQPVLPVKLSSTYRSLVPDGRLIVTVLPVDGLKVYPADPTSWLNVVPLVLPRTDSVSVRVLQADDGGRSSVTDPIGLGRAQVDRDGLRVRRRHRCSPSSVLVLPSVTLAGTYDCQSLLAVTGLLRAMLVVEVMPAPDSPTVSGVLLALLFTVRVPVFVAAGGRELDRHRAGAVDRDAWCSCWSG